MKTAPNIQFIDFKITIIRFICLTKWVILQFFRFINCQILLITRPHYQYVFEKRIFGTQIEIWFCKQHDCQGIILLRILNSNLFNY